MGNYFTKFGLLINLIRSTFTTSIDLSHDGRLKFAAIYFNYNSELLDQTCVMTSAKSRSFHDPYYRIKYLYLAFNMIV